MKFRCLILGRKVMTNLDSILKSRDITLSTKVHVVKAMVFPVLMYGCESQTIKKAECWRIDAFELWCWRRLLRVPWTARRSNQSILKEISPGCSLEGWCWSWNSNILVIWCEELTPWKRPWCWERLKVGGEGDDRGRDGWMASLTQWTWVWVSSGNWWWTGKPGVLQSMGLQRVGHDWAIELNWTDGMGEPGGLQSMGSHIVGHDWSDLAAAAAELMGLGYIKDCGVCLALSLSVFLSHPHIAHHSINPSLSHLSGGCQLSCLLNSPMNWSFLAAAMLVSMKLILLPIEMVLVLSKIPPGYHFIRARTTQLTNSSWFLIHRRSHERINVCCFKLLS